jgi:hypothetical protein
MKFLEVYLHGHGCRDQFSVEASKLSGISGRGCWMFKRLHPPEQYMEAHQIA